MKFVNLTPHDIVVQLDAGTITIPASGIQARCSVFSVPAGTLKVDNIDIPVNTVVYGNIVGLPDPHNDTIYITSSLVAQRAARPDVLAPDTGASAIRNDAGQIVAVTALQTFADNISL